MALKAHQYSDPFIYRGLTVDGNAGTQKTLRTLIAAVANGLVPPVPILALELTPTATVRVFGGRDPQTALPRIAAAGGSYHVVTASGKVYDLSDCLDNIWITADGAGSTTIDVTFYTTGQAGAG